MLDLAIDIIKAKAGHFEPEKFEDRYEKALRQLISKKQRGEKVDAPKEPQQAGVINLLDALRQSTAAERGAGRAHPRRAVTSGRQKSERRLKRSARTAN
jgi:DNA end-binding protein Ku